MNRPSLQLELFAAALLCALLAAAFDIWNRRIPNLLTGPAVLVALGLHLAAGGWQELLSSFGSLCLCGAVFLVFYLAGGMGAGDVKLIAAEGCLLGLSNALSLLVLTAICGGVLAIGYAALGGKLASTCRNVLALAAHHTQRGLRPHPELNVLNDSTLRMPYALAIGAGVLLTVCVQVSGAHPW